MPDYWQTEPGPGVWLQGLGIPKLLSYRSGSGEGEFPDTVGYGVLGVPKLALACSWAGPGLSWSRGRVWPVVSCRIVVCFILLSAPWWAWLVWRLEQAPWRVGPLPAHWWAELVLGPLVGWAGCRGVSRGGCGLQKSLGILSADGGVASPAQLVVWPEAVHHYRLLGEARCWC